MANPTMKQILDQTRALVGTKLAAAKSAEIVGQAPSSMPGAEHDKPVDASTKKPDTETRDGTMVPASGTSTSGAGDDSPITRGHALESDESAKEPAKKPAITADANAKTAGDGTADLANDILSMVRGAQKAAAAAPAAPAAAPVKAAAAPAPAAPVKKDPAPEKVAGQLNMELTTDVMAKIAALILSTEEGAAMANGVLEKAAGAEAARETMAFLAEQAELAEKAAAYEQGLADADRAIAEQIFAAGVKQGQAQMQKHPLFKLGQDAADASMGGLPPEAAAAMAGGAGGAPDAGGAMPPDAGAAGGAPDAGGGQVSSEDIVGALQMLVDDGTLQPEEAQQVLDALTGGGAGAEAAGAAAGGAAPDAGAGAADAGGEGGSEGGEGGGESEGGADPEKEASAKAGKLLAAIKAIQAK